MEGEREMVQGEDEGREGEGKQARRVSSVATHGKMTQKNVSTFGLGLFRLCFSFSHDALPLSRCLTTPRANPIRPLPGLITKVIVLECVPKRNTNSNPKPNVKPGFNNF